MPTPLTNHPRLRLEHLHPAGKVLACLALVIAAIALPPPAWPRLAWPAAGLLVVWLAARLPLGLLLRRLALVLPFVVLAALSLPFLSYPEPHVVGHWGPLTLTHEGLLTMAAALAKAFLCVLALSLLGAVTAPHDLLGALRSLRVPGLLVTVLSLTIRYLFLLQEEAVRMMHARDARGMPRTLRRRARVAGAMIGSLFLRSWERAERVGQAMTARGFTGALPVLSNNRWRLADALVLALALAAAVGMVIA